jgi:antitoxin (DNA-binding transcriptional repressor) of toxin-antitoxin stability system
MVNFISKFKEQCLSLLDHLDPEGIVVTKHGKAVARVIPLVTRDKKIRKSKLVPIARASLLTTQVSKAA